MAPSQPTQAPVTDAPSADPTGAPSKKPTNAPAANMPSSAPWFRGDAFGSKGATGSVKGGVSGGVTGGVTGGGKESLKGGVTGSTNGDTKRDTKDVPWGDEPSLLPTDSPQGGVPWVRDNPTATPTGTPWHIGSSPSTAPWFGGKKGSEGGREEDPDHVPEYGHGVKEDSKDASHPPVLAPDQTVATEATKERKETKDTDQSEETDQTATEQVALRAQAALLQAKGDLARLKEQLGQLRKTEKKSKSNKLLRGRDA